MRHGSRSARRLPIGAEPLGADATSVRVWAPAAARVDVVVRGGATTALAAEPDGYFSGTVPMGPGALYEFALDGGERLYPDPASRFQPDGPHGPSEVVDPSTFSWTDGGWRGAALRGQVVYEMHVGTFTREGTWPAAARELPELARLGITIVEMMPIADFDGRFGWGYDGVDLFAPTRLYGRPDDLRRFVDLAHRAGIGVILDVVYNHLGPSGNYLRQFSPGYFSAKHDNEWGEALNFDGDGSGPVREFFISNAAYWIDEFHLDGLRLDATQQMFDDSAEHIIAAIARRTREAAGARSVVLVAENERQEVRLARPPSAGGYGLDALWNDDFHHSAMVALTGRREAYYTDTYGVAQEFVSAAKRGYLYQGQHYAWQRKARGTPSWGLDAPQFVAFLQNHDQVANSALGVRGHLQTSPGRWRAMTALLLLMPSTPMLFQGQEFAASAPFLYFADFDADLAAGVRLGRAEFLTQFPSISAFLATSSLDDPASVDTFERCKLDFAERLTHATTCRLHEDLLRLRRDDATIARQGDAGIDGAVLGRHAFVLRFFSPDHTDDRLLVVNFGGALHGPSFAEPLLAPAAEQAWSMLWASDDPRYGGPGMPNPWPLGEWHVPGECAFLLRPSARTDAAAPGIRRRTA
ncbi:MAG TPA: malto-oligosyltrehalose trehalohydrolase [Vicinamibacterales bacterium]|nr:malto-oligosyltrehalose trehalohydrolase [Vicinamibacterales bacterium]